MSATVIYLYTYPTLLVRLVPLLARLFSAEDGGGGTLRAVVTLTYHLPNDGTTRDVTIPRVDATHDMQLCTGLRCPTKHTHTKPHQP